MKTAHLLASLLILGAAACGNSGSAPSGSGAAAGSGAPASGSGAAATGSGAPAPAEDNTPDDPSIKVLSQGAAPQTKLRYHPADGATETMLLLQTRSEAFVGQKPRSVPSSKLTLLFTTKAKTPTGDREGTYEVKDAVVEADGSVAPALAREVQGFLKKVIGMGGAFVVSDRGLVRSVTPTATGNVDPVTKQFIDSLADSVRTAMVPVPSAALGAGAKWEHNYEAQQAGITVKMQDTFEVKSVNGDEVKLAVSQIQRADKETMSLGGGPKVTVSNYKNDGAGEVTLNLKRLTPQSVITKNQGSMVMDGLPVGKKDVRLTTTLTITGS